VEYSLRYFFKEHGNAIVAIARCESRLNNLAINKLDTNGFASIGLTQISMIHGMDREYLLVPHNNAKEAYKLFIKAKGTFKPWYNCARSNGLLG